MARIEQDRDDYGKTIWVVLDDNDRIVIITQHEHTAIHYYEKTK